MSTDESEEETRPPYIEEPSITADVEKFFANYSSIPSSALRDHLIKVRQRAWQNQNYPCLGRWSFLDFSIQQNPIYAEIFQQCKNEGATMIDFGCCLGQDIRQLVNDGVPLSQLRGYELNPFFIEQGYELFRDGETMRENKIFKTGDIFDDEFLNGVEPADYVYVGSFIHLFDAATQREVCHRLSRLAKRVIAGRQSGAPVAGEHSRRSGLPGSKMMMHSPESVAEMWREVTHGEWQVEIAALQSRMEMLDRARLVFVVRKQEKK